MGKKQALIEARKNVSREIEQDMERKYSNNIELTEEEEREIELEKEKEKERLELEKQDEMIKTVQNKIFDYVKFHNLPLAEYVSLDDIEKFYNDIAL